MESALAWLSLLVFEHVLAMVQGIVLLLINGMRDV